MQSFLSTAFLSTIGFTTLAICIVIIQKECLDFVSVAYDALLREYRFTGWQIILTLVIRRIVTAAVQKPKSNLNSLSLKDEPPQNAVQELNETVSNLHISAVGNELAAAEEEASEVDLVDKAMDDSINTIAPLTPEDHSAPKATAENEIEGEEPNPDAESDFTINLGDAEESEEFEEMDHHEEQYFHSDCDEIIQGITKFSPVPTPKTPSVLVIYSPHEEGSTPAAASSSSYSFPLFSPNLHHQVQQQQKPEPQTPSVQDSDATIQLPDTEFRRRMHASHFPITPAPLFKSSNPSRRLLVSDSASSSNDIQKHSVLQQGRSFSSLLSESQQQQQPGEEEEEEEEEAAERIGPVTRSSKKPPVQRTPLLGQKPKRKPLVRHSDPPTPSIPLMKAGPPQTLDEEIAQSIAAISGRKFVSIKKRLNELLDLCMDNSLGQEIQPLFESIKKSLASQEMLENIFLWLFNKIESKATDTMEDSNLLNRLTAFIQLLPKLTPHFSSHQVLHLLLEVWACCYGTKADSGDEDEDKNQRIKRSEAAWSLIQLLLPHAVSDRFLRSLTQIIVADCFAVQVRFKSLQLFFDIYSPVSVEKTRAYPDKDTLLHTACAAMMYFGDASVGLGQEQSATGLSTDDIRQLRTQTLQLDQECRKPELFEEYKALCAQY